MRNQFRITLSKPLIHFKVLCFDTTTLPLKSIFPVLIITNATVCYYESFYPAQCTTCCLFVNRSKLCLPVLPTMIDPSRPSALKAHHYPRRAFRLHEMFMLVQLSVSCLLAVSCSQRIMTRLPRFGRESSCNGEASDSTLVSQPQDKTGLVLRQAFCYLEMHKRTSHLIPSPIARGMQLSCDLKPLQIKHPPPESILVCSGAKHRWTVTNKEVELTFRLQFN